MADAEPKKPNAIGCGLVVLAVVGVFVGGGLWLGKRKDAAMTPCERYGAVANRILYNCHSGLEKSPEHHTAVCEQHLDATPECLQRMESLTCDELRRPLKVATGAACARK